MVYFSNDNSNVIGFLWYTLTPSAIPSFGLSSSLSTVMSTSAESAAPIAVIVPIRVLSSSCITSPIEKTRLASFVSVCMVVPVGPIAPSVFTVLAKSKAPQAMHQENI